MATLSITVTSAQATRAMTAFGHQDMTVGSPTYGQWVPANGQAMADAIKGWVKEQTVAYENMVAANADRETRLAEPW